MWLLCIGLGTFSTFKGYLEAPQSVKQLSYSHIHIGCDPRKVASTNCALFKAVASVNKELATATAKEGKLKATYAVNKMANYCVPTVDDHYKLTKTENASFRGREDYQLYHTKRDQSRDYQLYHNSTTPKLGGQCDYR